MRSAIRILLAVAFAVVFVGAPALIVAAGVQMLRFGTSPDWPLDLWHLAALGQFIGGLALAMVGGVAIGMKRWPDRVWPHLVQLWGAGLIAEAALQMVFLAAATIPTDEIDGVYVVDRWPFLWTVGALAVVVTPALVVWRTRTLLRSTSHATSAVIPCAEGS